MTTHNLHLPFQSAYKKYHSVETAILRVQSDILKSIDDKQCVLLVLLDLSAAFDTIDHAVLITRLQSHLGLTGNALELLKSYITERQQAVIINGKKSVPWNLEFGVPQGSVLGTFLFSIYTSPLGHILDSMNIGYHFYADDTQIYISFNEGDSQSAVERIESVISVVRSWMAHNFLCLNDDKTKMLVEKTCIQM